MLIARTVKTGARRVSLYVAWVVAATHFGSRSQCTLSNILQENLSAPHKFFGFRVKLVIIGFVILHALTLKLSISCMYLLEFI